MMYYDVIYHLTEEVAKEMAGELGPRRSSTWSAARTVKEVFKSGKKDKAAGLLVEEGVIKQGSARPSHPRRCHRFGHDHRQSCGGSRTMWTKCAPASNAAWCWPIRTTSRPGDQLEVFEVEERERIL